MSRQQYRKRPFTLVGMVAGLVAILGAMMAASVAEAAPSTVASGTLSWGVKTSFRDYVRGPVANGSISPNLNVFTFAATGGTFDSDAGTAAVDFSGEVTFLGHDGVLEMTLANPRVELSGSTGTLYVDVISRAFVGADPEAEPAALETHPNLAFAQLSGSSWSSLSATLSADGAAVFGVYPPGTELDPISITLNSGGAPGTATPDHGTFSPAPGRGVTLTVWGGGNHGEIARAVPDAKSLWVTVDGQFTGYVVGAPMFVNADFVERYPTGLPAGTVVVVVR